MLNIGIQLGPGRSPDKPEQLPGVHPAHARQGIRMTQRPWAGIDVSSTRLDVDTFPASQPTSFAYTDQGLADLGAWLAQHPVAGIAVEATGGYERRVVHVLQKCGHTVRVLNPRRVRRFAEAITPAKNDRIDARLIAHFAATIAGEPAPPHQPDRAAVDELVKLRQMLSQHHVALTNAGRLTRTAEAKALLTQQIKAVKAAIDQAADDIEAAINRSQRLHDMSELVRSMPGIGPTVAAAIVAMLPELGHLPTAKIAALVGVAPFDDDSGGRSGARHIAGGRMMLRNLFYMASLSACRYNPVMRSFHERLIARGKPPKVALVAVMHKMIARLNAMAHTGQKWDETHQRAHA